MGATLVGTANKTAAVTDVVSQVTHEMGFVGGLKAARPSTRPSVKVRSSARARASGQLEPQRRSYKASVTPRLNCQPLYSSVRSQHLTHEPHCTRPVAMNSLMFHRPSTSTNGHQGKSTAPRNLLSSALYERISSNSVRIHSGVVLRFAAPNLKRL